MHVAVETVDGDGGILDHDLARTGRGHRCVAHSERSIGLIEPCCLIVWFSHGMSDKKRTKEEIYFVLNELKVEG